MLPLNAGDRSAGERRPVHSLRQRTNTGGAGCDGERHRNGGDGDKQIANDCQSLQGGFLRFAPLAANRCGPNFPLEQEYLLQPVFRLVLSGSRLHGLARLSIGDADGGPAMRFAVCFNLRGDASLDIESDRLALLLGCHRCLFLEV
jgi:hypothetical protein